MVHRRVKLESTLLSPMKLSVPETEKLARKIMLAEIDIWDKYGWESGGEIQEDPKKMKIYEKELKKSMKDLGVGKLPNFYYNIFEDANWHLMNKTLDKFGYFKNKEPYAQKDADSDYKKYRSLGGKTWKLI